MKKVSTLFTVIFMSFLLIFTACDGGSGDSGNGGNGDGPAEGTKLTSLTYFPLADGTMTPEFNPETLDYTLEFADSVETAGITAVAQEGATLSYQIDNVDTNESTVTTGLNVSSVAQKLKIIVTNGDASSTYSVIFGNKAAIESGYTEPDPNDTTAPTFTAGPTKADTSTTAPGSFTITATTDENSKLYYVAVTSGTKPSADQVVNGKKSDGSSAEKSGYKQLVAGQSGTETVSDIAAGSYQVYALAMDVNQNKTEVKDLGSFTASAASAGGKLIISALLEPDAISPAAENKYIVITNIGTTTFTGTSDWSVKDIRDFGGSSPYTPSISDGKDSWSLNGVTILPGESKSFGDSGSSADYTTPTDGDWTNGDWSKETDGAMIVNGTTIIDVVVGEEGQSTDFENKIILRKATVTEGVTTSNNSEWISFVDFEDDFPITSVLDYRILAAYGCESKNGLNQIEADTSINGSVNNMTWAGNKSPDPATDLNFAGGAYGNTLKLRNIEELEADSNYLEFTITGTKIILKRLSLNIKRDTGFSTTPSWSIRTSADSYASVVHSNTIDTVGASWTTSMKYIDLSPIGEVNSSITIRLTFYGEDCDADAKEILLDNIMIHGHVE
jgi:hypothetical protein